MGAITASSAQLGIITIDDTPIEVKEEAPNPSCCLGGNPSCVCCFRTRKWCCLCCVLPCVIFLVGIGILVFIFWPRCITAAADKSNLNITALTYRPLPAKVDFGAAMDVVIKNDNHWGIAVDYVKVTAKYRDAVLGVGELKDGLSVAAAATSRFSVTVKQEASAKAATAAATAAPYFAKDCALPNTKKTWVLTMNIQVQVLSMKVAFDVNFDVPCTGAVDMAAATYDKSPSSSGDENKCLIPGMSK